MNKPFIVGGLIFLFVCGLFLGNELGMFSTTGFTPVFCAEYEYKCCAQDNSYETNSVANAFYINCPTDAGQCVLNNFQDSTGSVLNSIYEYESCSGTRDCIGKGKLLSVGDSVVGGHCIGDCTWILTGTRFKSISTKNYIYRLFDCGLSPCGGTGNVISPNCNWVGNRDTVYDQNGNLIKSDYTGLYTVPKDRCFLTSSYANRRICGSLEEKCSVNLDCASQYPYKYGDYGATCSQNMLTLYGCVSGAKQECIYIDDKNGNGIQDNGETCLEYTGISYCSVVAGQQKPVECCPDSTYACGANAVCDPKTFTCQTTRDCDYDWQCESAGTSCDYVTKKLNAWGCLSTGKCGIKSSEDVQCCFDTNCPTGYFCDTDYKCKQRVNPLPECDKQCCEKDGQHIDKPCAAGLKCLNGICVDESNACYVDSDCNDGVWYTWDSCKRTITEKLWNNPGKCEHKDLTIVLIVLGVVSLAIIGGIIYSLKKK